MEIIKLKNDSNINGIVTKLLQDKVIIFPTDTVYGLGGRADKLSVIKKVYKLKKRAKKNPLLILVSSMAMAKKYVKINRKQEVLLKKWWSPYAKASGGKTGALTAVLKSKKVLPRQISGDADNIGVRVPNYPLILKVVRKLKVPLIATSANISGQPSMLDVKDIKIKPDFIIDGGRLPASKESTVVDLTEEEVEVLRQGAVLVLRQ